MAYSGALPSGADEQCWPMGLSRGVAFQKRRAEVFVEMASPALTALSAV